MVQVLAEVSEYKWPTRVTTHLYEMLLDIEKKKTEKGSNEIDEKPLAWQGVALNNELSEKDALRTPCDFNVNSQTL